MFFFNKLFRFPFRLGVEREHVVGTMFDPTREQEQVLLSKGTHSMQKKTRLQNKCFIPLNKETHAASKRMCRQDYMSNMIGS